MNVRFGSFLSSLGVLYGFGLSQVQAQPVPAPAPVPPQPAPNLAAEGQNANAGTLAPTLAKIRQLNQQGLYRELIATATEAMAKVPQPNQRLSYWRGLGERRLALLDAAKKDLQPLGDFAPNPQFPPASRLLEQTETLLALRPPHEFDVRSDDGKTVLYRVYSSDDDEFLHTILTALPKAYKTASAFTGQQTDEIPVFVFNLAHYPDFVKFFSTMSGKPVLNWSQAVTRNGTITISQRSERNAKGRPSNDPRLTRTLSHETTHQLMRGLIGTRTETPNWFVEGIAQVCENTLDPVVYTQNDKAIQRLVNQDAILPLDKIEGGKDFHDAVTQSKNGEQKGEPYPQGLSMTRTLITLLKGQTMGAFLQSIRDENSFNAALLKSTGLTPQQFYANWKATLPAKTDAITP